MERRKSKQPSRLECKRREDDAWSECEVSVDSMGPETVLRVQFSESEEETIYTLEEAKLRMRPLSKPLENHECLRLQEGDVVLAAREHESGKCRFYDAQIMKVNRHKHSSHSLCKCTFEIRWMDGMMKGDNSNVFATQIHQVVHGSIHDHLVISRWLKQVNISCGHQLEASDIESDDQAQLEEEIDKITMLACSIEKTNPSENFESRPLADESAGNLEEKDTAGRRRRAKNRVESVARLTRARTGSHKQAQSVNAFTVHQTGAVPSASLLEKRPRLSPLAARAALAAAVQEARPESMVTSKGMYERSVENIKFRVEERDTAQRRDQGSVRDKGTKRKRGRLPYSLQNEASAFETSHLPRHSDAAKKSGDVSSAKDVGTERKKGRPARARPEVDGNSRMNESHMPSPLHVHPDKMQRVVEERDDLLQQKPVDNSVAKTKRRRPPRALSLQDGEHAHLETREIEQDMAVSGLKRRRGYPRSPPLLDGESGILESSQRKDSSPPNLVVDQMSICPEKNEEAHQSEEQVSKSKFRKKSDIIAGDIKDDERKGLSGVGVVGDQPIRSLRRSSRLSKLEEKIGSDYNERGVIGGVTGGNLAKQGDCIKTRRKRPLSSKENKAVEGVASCVSAPGPVGKGKQLQEHGEGDERLKVASRLDLTVELGADVGDTVELGADVGDTGSPGLQLQNKNVNFDVLPTSGTCLERTGCLSSPAATTKLMQAAIEEIISEETVHAPSGGAAAGGQEQIVNNMPGSIVSGPLEAVAINEEGAAGGEAVEEMQLLVNQAAI